MTALSYCIDSVPQNFVEFLVAEGFDVWLFDWRTSPLLDGHERPYTFDDVARYDWPAAVAEVQLQTGKTRVSVLAHCLSSPAFFLSLLRGYTAPSSIRAFVASQVGLHLEFTRIGTAKLKMRLDRLLPAGNMIHQKPSQTVGQVSDLAVSALSCLLPTTFSCNNRACQRHVATFGELILHSRIDPVTHAIIGDLVPECVAGFVKDVAVWGRRDSILTDHDSIHLDRLSLPIHLISGEENRMFIPRSTERTYQLLCDANGSAYYKRTVFPGFGHLDCYFGKGASTIIWPSIVASLDGEMSTTPTINTLDKNVV
jgi:cholesterol oxidase